MHERISEINDTSVIGVKENLGTRFCISSLPLTPSHKTHSLFLSPLPCYFRRPYFVKQIGKEEIYLRKKPRTSTSGHCHRATLLKQIVSEFFFYLSLIQFLAGISRLALSVWCTLKTHGIVLTGCHRRSSAYERIVLLLFCDAAIMTVKNGPKIPTGEYGFLHLKRPIMIASLREARASVITLK